MVQPRYAKARLAVSRGYRVLEDGTIIGSRGVPIRGTTYNQYRAVGVKVENRKVVHVKAHHIVVLLKYGSQALKGPLQVRHLDGNKLNCAWSNIVLGSMSQNMLDKPKEMRVAIAKKAASARRKITQADAEAMRAEHAAGIPMSRLMQKYGTGKTAMWYIISNRTYRS
jgi:hypothetical protein